MAIPFDFAGQYSIAANRTVDSREDRAGVKAKFDVNGNEHNPVWRLLLARRDDPVRDHPLDRFLYRLDRGVSRFVTQ
jgi:hypothetical protein